MVRFAIVVMLAGCFSPRPPSGVACDPLTPNCPAGQVCRAEAGGYVCKEPGTDEVDAAIDVPTDANLFPHIAFKQGYSGTIFRDYSSLFTYVANDWQEATELYDNQPDYIFPLQTPFPQALGMIVGRKIIAIDGGTLYEQHDYGQHVVNAGGDNADNLTGAMFVANLAGSPGLLVSSASEDGGDGAFIVRPTTWAITLDRFVNNTRCILADPAGTFDSRGTATRYLGAQNGVVRIADNIVIVAGDTKSMRLAGSDILITRLVGTVERLIRVDSITHAETPIAEATRFRILDATPPNNRVAWALVDGKKIVTVNANGNLDVIAELLDSQYVWTSATMPPAGHPLAGRLYLLESNRALGIDRIIAISN